MGEPFLTIEEISAHLSIKKSSLYRMVERKEIPHYKIGCLIRFKKSEIDLWVEKSKVDPADCWAAARRIVRNSSRKPEGTHGTKKTIAEAGNPQYNVSCGKPD